VNDGSRAECQPIFDELQRNHRCVVLHHAKNMGKGRALKTGLNFHCLNNNDSLGVVTADADGQHRPEDILRVAERLAQYQDRLIIGTRTFSKSIPLKSYLGNTLTKYLFYLLIGKKISDTQSGLRGLPYKAILNFIGLEGERYDFEINMLMAAKEMNVAIVEENIETIYIDKNSSSHFNPLIDSMKIYFLLLRFTFSSLFASVLDFILFVVCYQLTQNVPLSIFVGRCTIGPFVNYGINRNFVFHSQIGPVVAIVKYLFLVVFLAMISYGMIHFLAANYGVNVVLAKVISELLLFAVSFYIQRELIFSSRTKGAP
jgi:glycosyltransferase involved in cell wall biosynthesis